MTKKLDRLMCTAAVSAVLALGAFSAPTLAVKETGGEYNTIQGHTSYRETCPPT